MKGVQKNGDLFFQIIYCYFCILLIIPCAAIISSRAHELVSAAENLLQEKDSTPTIIKWKCDDQLTPRRINVDPNKIPT